MLADTATVAPTALTVEPSARTVLFRETARRATRSGAVWGAIFGVIVASSALSYTKIYSTQAERDALATSFGSNNATAALFGPAPALQTVAGFTVFKSLMTIMVLGALWGLLTSTRLLRGEEDAGRWEMVLTGQATRRSATVQALAGLGTGLAALWLVAAVFTVFTGQDKSVSYSVGAGLYFALVQAAAPLMFLAVGALTSQLVATRRQAATLAGWFLGASYLLRMIADAGVGLHGLIWVSPLGWVEELQPLTSPQPLAVLPIAGFSAVVALSAVYLSARRDVGASVFRDHPRRPARLRLLFGQLGLSVRLLRSVTLGWLGALAASGLVLGLIAQQAGGTISGSSVQEVFARLGATGTGAQAFLGVSFLIVAVLAGFMAAGQATAARGEEAEGRVDPLVVGPVSRVSWLGGRVVLACAVLVIAGVVAGLSTWVGVEAQGGGVSLSTLLKAGINVVPAALCLLGIGVVAMGVWPRATSYVVYGYLGWSLLIEVVGGVGTQRQWLLDTSLFHQMAAAPAVDPNWTVNGVLFAIGAATALCGIAWFRRRDLAAA